MNRITSQVSFLVSAHVHRGPAWLQRKWQEYRLQRLMRHAARHVPLWKATFRDLGIDPESIWRLEDLRSLPVISKRQFSGRMVEEIIDNSRLLSSHWFVTSGTSGAPFQFLMSDTAIDPRFVDFASLRFMWWQGEPLSALTRARHVRIKIRGKSDKHQLFVPVGDVLTDIRRALGRMVAFRAEIISAYPSILLEMAQRISQDGTLPRPTPRYILSFGEMLAPSVRSFVSSVFGCDIYDRYGLEEIGVIGVECAMHDGFHVNTESVIVEILDDEQRPIAHGEEGRLVATDLLNFNMPFIRYDTGDRASFVEGRCACGLQSPRIRIEGRYTASLVFGGRRYHHLEFDGAMDGFMDQIFQYQIAKTSEHSLVVRIVPGPHYRESVHGSIIERIRALVGEAVCTDIEVVGSLPLTERGKCRIVFDETGSGSR